VITTATRTKAIAVPIQAMTVREMIVDKAGNIVRNTPPPGPAGSPATAKPMPAEPKEGETRKEVEGVFLVKDGRATFVAVKLGIAGEKYFESLSGLKDGDEVIVGPTAVARTLRDGDAVKATSGSGTTPTPSPAR
jgi:HlyD family secretion protein